MLLLDNGDAIQDNVLVNLSQGKSAIEFMNSTGFYTGYSDTDALINYIKTELSGVIGESYTAPQGRITVSE